MHLQSVYQFVTLITAVLAAPQRSATQRTSDLLERTLTALEDSLMFMYDDYKLLNLDGVSGLRIIQGQLELIRENLPRGGTETWSNKLKVMETLCTVIIDKAVPEIERYDRSYFNQLGMLIEKKLWTFSELQDKQLKKLESVEGDEGKSYDMNEERMTENESDACLAEMLQYSTEGETCRISKPCLSIMTSDGASSYTATHQVYYLAILSQSKCLPEYADKAIEIIEQKKCQSILLEATTGPKTQGLEKDMFMEQVGICGLVGFWRDFSQLEWIDMILSWQRPEGCYGQSSTFLEELDQIEEKRRFRRGTNHHRVKREERVMSNECLCHRTTVAALALTQHIKALLL